MFHVPNQYRLRSGPMGSTDAAGNNGAFIIPCPPKPNQRGQREFSIIASVGMGWEHVSVHIYEPSTDRTFTPSWDEMCYIKGIFWEEEDAVMQLHPPASLYVNIHPNTLHLWRRILGGIPLPPTFLV